MKKLKKSLSVVCLTLFIVGIMSTGCTKYASQEQLKALEDCNKANVEAEKKITALKKEKAQLEQKISDKESVLRKFERDLNAVK